MTLFNKLCSILNLPWMGRKEREREKLEAQAYVLTKEINRLRKAKKRFSHVYEQRREVENRLLEIGNKNSIYDHG